MFALCAWTQSKSDRLDVSYELTVTKNMADLHFAKIHCGRKSFKDNHNREVFLFVLLKFFVLRCFSWHLFSVVLVWCPQCILVKFTCYHRFRYGQLYNGWALVQLCAVFCITFTWYYCNLFIQTVNKKFVIKSTSLWLGLRASGCEACARLPVISRVVCTS